MLADKATKNKNNNSPIMNGITSNSDLANHNSHKNGDLPEAIANYKFTM